MDAEFWRQRWEKNEIAFHRSDANPLLVKYFDKLALAQGGRVFLPLCGKTRDIAWLLSNGYSVAGAELSEKAIAQLFAELEVEPKIAEIGEMKHYSAENIDMFVGDIFELTSTMLGAVDAIYDRAALVALPKEIRNQYAEHLMAVTDNAPQLLITYEYDQSLMDGPPFSISSEEVSRHYNASYDLTPLVSMGVAGGLKGICAATENVWRLQARRYT